MTCHTTITPEPIPGIDDMTAITAHRLADALDLLREYRALAATWACWSPATTRSTVGLLLPWSARSRS